MQRTFEREKGKGVKHRIWGQVFSCSFSSPGTKTGMNCKRRENVRRTRLLCFFLKIDTLNITYTHRLFILTKRTGRRFDQFATLCWFMRVSSLRLPMNENYYHGLHTRHSLPEFDSEKKLLLLSLSILCPFSSENLSNDTGSVSGIFIHVFDFITANNTLFFIFNQLKFYQLVQELKVSRDVYLCS